MHMINCKKITIFFIAFSFILTTTVYAETVEEIKDKINDRNDAISKLESEIRQYQSDIDALGKEKDSLSNTIKSLDISKKKLQADTKITENKIAAKNLEIKELTLQIGDKGDRISDGKRVITKALTDIYTMNSVSVIESILGQKSFSQMWRSADELTILQGKMQDKIKDLENLKTNLEENKKLTEKKKAELIVLTNDLKNQANIIASTVKEKKELLNETKNSEANYSRLLRQRELQKEAFEREINELESSLKLVIDPNSVPKNGSILRWPLHNNCSFSPSTCVRITQYFGKSNLKYYKSGQHYGIDFAATVGTPINAALTGEVVGVGSIPCAYGKWVMIKHNNGLSSLYGHLSLQTVTIGQRVETGDLIGYSGNTGVTTGPHLHFGLYATQGVQVKSVSTSCGYVLYPLADPSAHINPLSYL